VPAARPRIAFALALAVVLAGCGAPFGAGDAADRPRTDAPTATPTATPTPTPASTATPTSTAATETPERTGFADPETDRLGWEAGYWYDEPIPVNATGGLNATERRALVARTMARVERIRGLEFTSSVPITVRSRAAYLADENVTATAWDEQVWEALLLVGENRSVERVFESFYGASVQGSYVPSEGHVVVVSEGDDPTLDRRTLAHELVHALQDQHFGLNATAPTRDARLGKQGLIEGDAGYVADIYERRCRGNWSCVPRPSGGPAGSGVPTGVYVAAYQPYSDGPALVHRLRERGGWAAVDAAYADPPVSSAQVIHPERYPDWTPTRVRVPDRSNASWERFGRTPSGETVGEASVFALLWANGGVDPFHFPGATRPHRTYNYTHPASAGWVGDRVVPYRHGDDYGYVFRTEWASPGDAAAFADAYRALLTERRGAERVGDALVVPAGPYADAFRVRQNGTTVTVTNAPTVGALDAVHRSPNGTA
jgi:hypothetical protein